MTPAEYVNEIVVPTVRDARDCRQSRRHAYLACIVTFHMKDHLEKAGETDVHQQMQTACPEHFDVVRSVCNGTKHVVLNRGHTIPFVLGSDYYRPPASAGVMECGVSFVGDTDGGRSIRHNKIDYDLYGSTKTLLVAFQREFPQQLSSCDLNDC
jgi:hypothetical protein